jgi:hypothetical protein
MSLTLAEQYILESFPQSWMRKVEVIELPIEDYSSVLWHCISRADEEESNS